MMRLAIVKAAFDDEARVWYVESSDIEGLHVEGDTFDDFCRNVANATSDLIEGEGDQDIHVEIIGHTSIRARVAA